MPSRVLIVDDSRFARKMLEAILSHEPDFEVVGQAQNGAEGLKLIKELNPDVVTLDLDMPVLDGPSMLCKLRKWSQTPVVVVSGTPAEWAEQLGIDQYEPIAYVTKQISDTPLDLSIFTADLCRSLRQVISESCDTKSGVKAGKKRSSRKS